MIPWFTSSPTTIFAVSWRNMAVAGYSTNSSKLLSMAGSTIILFCSTLIVSILITTSIAVDTITANQAIRDGGNSTITSAGGVFELGFFSPHISKNRYLGIWYKIISTGTVVWVANRDTPLTDSSGVLRLDGQGTLVLVDGTDNIIWSSNSSRPIMNNSVVAQLLDNGNFVIRYGNERDPENYLWQSFDYPGDHILPGMKLGWDFVKGLDRHFTSWKSDNDPSPGNYSFRVNLEGYPQMLVGGGNSVVLFRVGPWDGIKFGGLNFFKPNPIYTVRFVFNQKEIYYRYELFNSSNFMRIVLDPYGGLPLVTWIDQTQSWESYQPAERDDCDLYALCGAYSSCYLTKSQLGYVTCRCLVGYQPKFSANWNLADWSGGCVRQTPLDCENGDIFVKYTGLKLPDTRQSWFNQSMVLEDCKMECLKNCSCTAYTTGTDIREGGMGCLLWFGDLIDIRDYGKNGLNLYIRMAVPKLEANRSSRRKKMVKICIIVILVVVVLTILLGLFLIHVSKKKKLRKGIVAQNPENDARNGNEREDLELPLFDFQLIANVTDNFSNHKKLGEGGFGPVYKGILEDGQEIAVKRLSKSSQQGLDEFKNEVSCIAKLQHRNLVRLLGCCIEEGEMLLIYEYMPNKSLDSFIFNNKLSKVLDWPKRYNIINGIAKGLLYLHQDSRLRIIHRDLKTSNILLDYEMNPRISDFGLARTFGGNETAVNTAKVVGTCGYMAPEYVIDGLFSVKSDVYSFGVVVLEIVSGKKIRGLYHSDHKFNLLSHAWKLYKEGNVLELIDGAIVNFKHFEVFRAIRIGLLCVQPYPKDRPSMSTVVSMLSSENELPQPKEPGFFTERLHEPDSSSNDLTVTFFTPR